MVRGEYLSANCRYSQCCWCFPSSICTHTNQSHMPISAQLQFLQTTTTFSLADCVHKTTKYYPISIISNHRRPPKTTIVRLRTAYRYARIFSCTVHRCRKLLRSTNDLLPVRNICSIPKQRRGCKNGRGVLY